MPQGDLSDTSVGTVDVEFVGDESHCAEGPSLTVVVPSLYYDVDGALDGVTYCKSESQ
jgi:hypothetical protein